MSRNAKLDKDGAIKEIIDRITKGESLRSILHNGHRESHLPVISTFLLWVSEDKQLSEQYACACAIRADLIFEEIREIADDGSNDFMKIVKGDVEYETENKEVVSRSRLRVDTLKWMLGKMNPKKYGDRIQVAETDVEGKDKISNDDIEEIRTLVKSLNDKG